MQRLQNGLLSSRERAHVWGHCSNGLRAGVGSRQAAERGPLAVSERGRSFPVGTRRRVLPTPGTVIAQASGRAVPFKDALQPRVSRAALTSGIDASAPVEAVPANPFAS